MLVKWPNEPKEPIWLYVTALVACLCLYGCDNNRKADDPTVIQKIDSFDKIEQEIGQIKRTVQIPDAHERIYYDLFVERDEILKIAEGNFSTNNNVDTALIRKMAWVILGELHTRRPGFDILVDRAEPKPKQPVQAEATAPEDFK